MGLPSGDTITINSGSSTLRGNKSFSVSIEASYTSTTTQSMTISDIGDYEYNVDVKEDTTDVNEFYVNVPTFSFSFWSELTGGIDFGDVLNQLTFQDLIKIEVSYNGNTDYFICQKSDFKYDRLKREVECECFSPLKYGGLLSGGQIATFDTSTYEITATYSDDDPQEPSANLTDYTRLITFNDLLTAYLDTFNSDSVIKQTHFTTTKSDIVSSGGGNALIYTLEFQGSTLDSSVTTDGNFYLDNGFQDARARILEASIAEAAMVGNGFGTAFYVKRNDQINTVAIDSSHLEEFNIQFFTSPVKSIQVGVGDTSSSETIMADNPQTVIVEVPSFAADVTFQTLSSTLYAEGSSNPSYSPTQGDNDDLLVDYKNILGVSDSVLFSGIILGASKVKPYQTITLDTGISDFVDSTNNIIRFSKVKYNLKEDKMEWEGYSIN